MQYTEVRTQNNISVVTLNRPDRLNAIGTTLLDNLHDALIAAMTEPSSAVIVLTGAGRAFCAGDDLKEFESQSASATAISAHVGRIQQITRDMMFGNKLIVGAIHGYAVGGGFEWMLNCDIVVAAEDLVAFFPEMALGHFVTGAVTHLLPLTVGYHRAMELLVLGERNDALTLLRMGLVNRVVPIDQHLRAAMEIASKIASQAPAVTSRLKKLLNTELSSQLTRALDLETTNAIAGFASVETEQRVRAFVDRQLSSPKNV